MRETPIEAFRSEILTEAHRVCAGHAPTPRWTGRLAHLRAILAMKAGMWALAAAYLKWSLRFEPDGAPERCHDLGNALLRKGDVAGGLAAHLKGLVATRDRADSLLRTASALYESSHPREAICLCMEALRLRPDDPDTHGVYGDSLRALGRLQLAYDRYIEGLRLAPSDTRWYLRVGEVALGLGRGAEALNVFQRGLSRNRKNADLHAGLGEAYLQLGAEAEALSAFRAALRLAPAHLTASRYYARLLDRLGRREDTANAWLMFGTALERHGSPAHAIAAYQQALTRKPNCLKALMSLARVYRTVGEDDRALKHLESAVTQHPERAQLHILLGRALYANGQHDRAWDELAWRHHPLRQTWRHTGKPVWRGSSLCGSTILLWADEQTTLGEIILSLRYVKFAKHHGGRVVVECPRPLLELVEELPEVDEVTVPSGLSVPFDVHAPLSLLPSLIPSARSFRLDTGAYLAVSPEARRRWRRKLRIDEAKRQCFVGIAWAPDPDDGPGEARRVSPWPLARLGQGDDSRVVSLQRGAWKHQLVSSPPGVRVSDAVDERCSLTELAAAVSCMDGVVTSSSVVAHLAGALGRPTWFLVGAAPPWPWTATAGRTPWYATLQQVDGGANKWLQPIERAFRSRNAEHEKPAALAERVEH